MRGLVICIISVLLLAPSLAIAQLNPFENGLLSPPEFPANTPKESSNLAVLRLVDVSTGECLSDVHIELFMSRAGAEPVETLRYVPNCTLTLDLEEGSWSIIARADDLKTDGKDYYSSVSLTQPDKQGPERVVLMKPAGSIIGTVTDSDGKIVSGARVKFDCSSDYGRQDEVQTDEYGIFKAEWLPQGQCKISALYQNMIGSTTVDLKKGRLFEVKVPLENEKAQSTNIWFYILASVMSLSAAYALLLKRRRQGLFIEEKRPSIKPSAGMSSIIETLPHEQRPLVSVLCDSGGKLRQADICLKTGISKASVSRYVYELESRKILATHTVGNLKEVRLSEWFLSQ
ncbi:MAG: hypothetical protein V1875_05580 [Candidatus Altiarchaeota archaeon]